MKSVNAYISSDLSNTIISLLSHSYIYSLFVSTNDYTLDCFSFF